MNRIRKDVFCRLATVDRFISADVYNEFPYRLSPETTLTVWQMGFGFRQDRIMGKMRESWGVGRDM